MTGFAADGPAAPADGLSGPGRYGDATSAVEWADATGSVTGGWVATMQAGMDVLGGAGYGADPLAPPRPAGSGADTIFAADATGGTVNRQYTDATAGAVLTGESTTRAGRDATARTSDGTGRADPLDALSVLRGDAAAPVSSAAVVPGTTPRTAGGTGAAGSPAPARRPGSGGGPGLGGSAGSVGSGRSAEGSVRQASTRGAGGGTAGGARRAPASGSTGAGGAARSLSGAAAGRAGIAGSSQRGGRGTASGRASGAGFPGSSPWAGDRDPRTLMELAQQILADGRPAEQARQTRPEGRTTAYRRQPGASGGPVRYRRGRTPSSEWPRSGRRRVNVPWWAVLVLVAALVILLYL